MLKPETGRVHMSYSQAVAVTGRVASADPNLQNIPGRTPEGRRIRAAFVAPENAAIVSAAPAAVGPDQRRVAKVINFGLIYGMSAFGLARYMETTRQMAREQGYVETVFGRRLWLPEIRSSKVGRRQGAERSAINAPMQGTAADLIKLAMIAVQRWLDARGMGAKLVLQVHLELVLEVPDAEFAEVRLVLTRLMCHVTRLAVPLLVELGWG